MHLHQQRASLPAASTSWHPRTARSRHRWTTRAPATTTSIYPDARPGLQMKDFVVDTQAAAHALFTRKQPQHRIMFGVTLYCVKSRRLFAAAAAATTAATTSPAARQEDPYTQLARLCGATGPVAVGETLRGRGLQLQQDMLEREALLTVPLANALIIADEPVNGISIFSDRQHRQWQELHGELPPLLLEFLQGDARWDARMAGWLLWMARHPSPLWSSYLALLPTESEMSCLLNFSQAEAEQLQVPRLKEEAAIQAGWCAHLHAKYFSTVTGSLAPLRLSDGLAHSLWAISLVRSRTFSEDVNGEMLTLMVPFCDMANHCSDHNSTFCINRDLKSFSLRSLRPLRQGQELTITYGAEKPNCEALRDYGFLLAGNAHDRIRWEHTENSKGGAAEGAGTGDKGSSSLSRLYGLNEACLMEAAGFTGDLAAGDILPLPSSAQPPLSPDQQQQLARREAALLSMPLKGAAGSSSEGGLLGWLDGLAQPWTDSGKPPPQPLQRQQVPAERAAIQALQQQLAQQLEQLPTSIETDQEVLRQLELHGTGVVFGGSSSESMPSVNQGATGSPSGSDSSGGDSVQQRRHGRLLQQAAGAAPRPMSPPLAQQQLADGGGRSPSTARLMAAVRARLEHKLLLHEGLGVLQQYSQHLTARFGA